MSFFYRRVDRDQAFLLAPDMRDWLPEDHLVWTVLDLVSVLDTGGFHAGARRGGAGRAGYDPDMLLGVLLYAYAVGVRSTRQIERLCHTDVALRIACAQDIPDHTVLARFRQDHAEAFVDLFGQVLMIAGEVGLGRFGTIAIDGTKIGANASLDANRGRDWVDAQVAAIVAEADALDAAEDAANTQGGQDSPPPRDWTDPGKRRARLAELVTELDAASRTARAQASQQLAEQRDAELAAGIRRRGGLPTGIDPIRAAQVGLAQVETRHQAKIDAWHARVAAGRNPGRRPKPVEDSGRVTAARRHLRAVEKRVQQQAAPGPDGSPQGGDPPADRQHPGPQVNLTDPGSRIQKTRRGWIQGYNAQLAVTADQIIVACALGQNQADTGSFIPMMHTATATATRLGRATGRDTTIGTVLADAGYASHDNLTAAGPDRLIALGKAHALFTTAKTDPTDGPPDPEATTRAQMAHRLATPAGSTLYKRRGATVEPAIGNLKKILPKFSRRGLDAATSELNLAAAVFNMLKIHRHALT